MAKKPTYIAISSEQLEGAINSYKNLNRSKGLEKYKNRFVGVPGVSLTIKNIIPRYCLMVNIIFVIFLQQTGIILVCFM